MDLKQLRYFTEIVDAGSVRQASEVVRISQPALTVAMQNLETELGVALFVRSGRNLTPTKEGHYLYRHARALLAQSDRLRVDMRALRSLDKAEVKIASPVMIATTVLAKPMAGFMRTHPDIRIQFKQMGGPSVEKALLQGDVDIGFLSRPPHGAEVAAHPICEREIRAFVGQSHPLCAQRVLNWLDLFSYPIATLPKNYVLHEIIQERAAFYRSTADIVLESDVLDLLIPAISENTLVGVLLHGHADVTKGLVNMPIHDVEGAGRGLFASVFACHIRAMPLSLAAETLLDYLGNTVAASPGDELS